MCYTGPVCPRDQHRRNQKYAQGSRHRFPRLDHRRLRLLRPGLLRLRHRERLRPLRTRRRAHHHRQPDDATHRRLRLRPARRPLWTPPDPDRQHRVLHRDGSAVRPRSQLHCVLCCSVCSTASAWAAIGAWEPRSRWNRCPSSGAASLRDPAGRLRRGQWPGRDCVLHDLSSLRLARHVLRRRDPGADHHPAVSERRGIPRVEGIENRRGQLSRDSVLELEALPVPVPDHVRDELHLAWHPGHVSDLPPEPARIQPAGRVDRHLHRRSGRDHRRSHARAFLEYVGPQAHDHQRDFVRTAGDSAVDPGARRSPC